MRRLLALAALSLVAVLHVPADASSPAQRVGLRLDFDGKGSGVYVIQGSVKADAAPPGLMASVSTDSVHAFFPEVLELRSGSASTTYGAAGVHSLCAAPAICTLSADGSTLDFSFSYSVSGDGVHEFHTRDYLVLEGAKVTITHTGVGAWTLHRFRSWTRVVDDQVAVAGARVAGADAEVDQTASAKGGAHGSVALAVPPCDVAGAGVATLTGGAAGAQAIICPSSAVAGLATKPTTWTLNGALAGATTLHTRLLVLPR